MGSEWARTVLGNVVHIAHGWPFKSEYFCPDQPELPIVVAIGNFQYTGGFRFGSTPIKYYFGEFPKEYILRPDEVLLVMTCQTAGGEILGIPGRVPNDDRTYLHNQRIGRVVIREPSRITSDFVYYVALSRAFNQFLFRSATGTKILHTSPGRIEDFEFELPPIEEQRGIAGLLRALDDRIDLLRQTNITLEAIAQAVFKSWFVDFDPVRAKAEGREPEAMDATTAAPFPSEFEESDLGPIPKGWSVKSFGDSVTILGGGTPKTSIPEYWDGDIPWFSVVDAPATGQVFTLDTTKTITQLGLENCSAKLLPPMTTIISARGTVGKVAMTGSEMAMNQSCYGLRPKVVGGEPFTYFSTLRFVDGLRQIAHGAVFDTITRSSFDQLSACRPPDDAIARFGAMTAPLLDRIRTNGHQATALAALRDTLLPRLISGKLRLPKAQTLIKEATL